MRTYYDWQIPSSPSGLGEQSCGCLAYEVQEPNATAFVRNREAGTNGLPVIWKGPHFFWEYAQAVTAPVSGPGGAILILDDSGTDTRDFVAFADPWRAGDWPIASTKLMPAFSFWDRGVGPDLMHRRNKRAIALLESWLAEEGSSSDDETDLESVKSALDQARQNGRRLFADT